MTIGSRVAVLLVALACLAPSSAWAVNESNMPCPWWRPCGPADDSFRGNRKFPQTAFGIDARPYCKEHDDCYDDRGRRRRDCDRTLYRQLKCECEQTKNPIACKNANRFAYVMLRIFAGSDKAR